MVASVATPPISKGRGEAIPRNEAVARLVSLDAFRGFIMFWIVGGGSLVLGLQALGRSRLIDTLVYQLNHSTWEGLRFYDCIWPAFMLMVGVSIPFSFAKRSQTQTQGQMFRHALRRFLILFLLGGMRASVSLGSPRLIELSSALQPIAIASLAGFLLVRKSWRFQALTGTAIILGYLLTLALVPVPGIGEVSYRLNANLVYAVDKAFLGHRAGESAFVEGWGTLLSTIPTVATTILGLLIGGLLRSSRSPSAKMRVIASTGFGGLVLGHLTSLWVPVVMKMWTASYGILSASWACLMFLAFYWVIDVLGFRKWAFPFVVIGVNALAAYLCGTVTRLPAIVRVFASVPAELMGPGGPLFSALSFLAVEWAILNWMYKRRIFLSA